MCDWVSLRCAECLLRGREEIRRKGEEFDGEKECVCERETLCVCVDVCVYEEEEEGG